MYPDTAGREGCPCSTEMENLTTTGQMKHGRLVYAQIDMMLERFEGRVCNSKAACFPLLNFSI